MKKFIKSIFAAMLCAIIAIGTVGTTTAQAADNATIKVTYKKKSVNLKVTDTGVKKVSYKTLKKKWGKPSDTQKEKVAGYCDYAQYTWLKGDTNICFTDNYETPERSCYYIMISDKNASINGIKIGTKKDKAVEILEDMGATVEAEKTYISVVFNDRVSLSFGLEKGKVTNLGASMYVSD